MKIVVALGGNALGDTPQEQLELVKNTAESIVDLVEQGHDVILVHGNGPQVGMIQSSFEEASTNNPKIPLMPLPECGAMSQGYIGYHLQNAIRNALDLRKLNREIATVVTQTLVDKDDAAFKNPTKPIGRFYTEAEANEIKKTINLPMVEDSGRGYRFVVASPKPVDIIEKNTIQTLLKNNTIVIASGGGGIPVIKEQSGLTGVPAVIDKDLSSAKLAMLIKADVLIILTAVNRVAINFGKPNQQSLEKMSIQEAENYIQEGHFAPGSMLPKVEAAMAFVNENKNAQAIIASLEEAALAMKGKSGTIVYK